MVPGNNLYETLSYFDSRIEDLFDRLRPLEKLGFDTDMAGKWLLKNSSRIKILEQRVSGIIRSDAHTEHRINELEAKMAALQRQADHIDDQALPSITCDLDVLRGRATAVEHTTVTTLIRMNDIVDLQQQIDELHDAICSHQIDDIINEIDERIEDMTVVLVDDLDEPAPIIDEIDERIDALIPSLITLMKEEGKTHREIRETLGISKNTVRNNLNAMRHGTKRHAQATWTEEDDAILIQGRKDGLTGQALTALFPDRVHGTVLNRLHALRAEGLVR